MGGCIFRRAAICVSLLLNACTLIYVAGDSNSLADSGNHSGTLNVPEPKLEPTGRLRRPEEP